MVDSGEGATGKEAGVTVERCWACSIMVHVPVNPNDPGRLATEFKCGWCGAITSKRSRPSVSNTNLSRCMRCVTPVFSYAAVTIVICLLTSVMALGYIYILPKAFDGMLMLTVNRLLVITMSFNILFNFVGCSVRSPGVPSPTLPASADAEDGGHSVPQGFYDNYQFCKLCKGPKPPRTHHCKVCGKCIIEMDHHCPFIGNCVGGANLRSFLVFLTWLQIGATYASIITGALLITKLGSFSIIQRGYKGHGPHVLSVFLLDLNVVPSWFYLNLYIFTVAMGSCIGVGVLLYSQVAQVIKGQTYIDSLKGNPLGDKGSGYVRMKRVCGGRGPWMWLLPSWEAVERSHDAVRKTS